MRVLILGATGFIGGQIARVTCAAGLEVCGLRRAAGAVGAAGDLSIRWIEGDLSDSTRLAQAMRGCDVLYHAAAYYPYFERDPGRAAAHARGQIRLLIAAARDAGIRRVVYTSSLTTIGGPPAGEDRLADERDAYVPGSTRNAYFEAKWVMEQEALGASGRDLEVVALIPTGVFGPGDVKPTTGQLLRDLARGRMPLGVDVVTNFVDGRDVALAHLRAAEQGAPGERYIIGGHNLSVGEMLREAAHAAGVRPPVATLPRGAAIRLVRLGAALHLPIPELARGLEYFQPLNSEKGWKTFALTPRPFADTARDTIAWFRQNGYL